MKTTRIIWCICILAMAAQPAPAHPLAVRALSRWAMGFLIDYSAGKLLDLGIDEVCGTQDVSEIGQRLGKLESILGELYGAPFAELRAKLQPGQRAGEINLQIMAAIKRLDAALVVNTDKVQEIEGKLRDFDNRLGRLEVDVEQLKIEVDVLKKAARGGQFGPAGDVALETVEAAPPHDEIPVGTFCEVTRVEVEDHLNVRLGPGTDFASHAQFRHDACCIKVTGATVMNDDTPWVPVEYEWEEDVPVGYRPLPYKILSAIYQGAFGPPPTKTRRKSFEGWVNRKFLKIMPPSE